MKESNTLNVGGCLFGFGVIIIVISAIGLFNPILFYMSVLFIALGTILMIAGKEEKPGARKEILGISFLLLSIVLFLFFGAGAGYRGFNPLILLIPCSIFICAIILLYKGHQKFKHLDTSARKYPYSFRTRPSERSYANESYKPRKRIQESVIISECSLCGRNIATSPYICEYCGKPFCLDHSSPFNHHCPRRPKHKRRLKSQKKYYSKECTLCGIHTDLPFLCKRCEKPFCPTHRLPESHNCEKLHTIRKVPLPQIPPKARIACIICGERTLNPFICKYCKKPFCSFHRLPEDHKCESLPDNLRSSLSKTGLRERKSCKFCNKQIDFPFICKMCNQIYCSSHRLAEDHRCEKIKIFRKTQLFDYAILITKFDRFCLICGSLILAGTHCEACMEGRGAGDDSDQFDRPQFYT